MRPLVVLVLVQIGDVRDGLNRFPEAHFIGKDACGTRSTTLMAQQDWTKTNTHTRQQAVCIRSRLPQLRVSTLPSHR